MNNPPHEPSTLFADYDDATQGLTHETLLRRVLGNVLTLHLTVTPQV